MRRFALLLGLLSFTGAGSAQHSAVRLTFPSSSEGRLGSPWVIRTGFGTSRVQVVPRGNSSSLHMRCDVSSFRADQRLNLDPARLPVLVWDWKAISLPPGDLRSPERNDQVLQLYLLFSEGRQLRGIGYFWDTNAPVGTSATQYSGGIPIRVLVVESGAENLGEWKRYQRDVVEDYRRLYGSVPTRLQGIRLQTNCQHTGSRTEGYFGEVQLFARGQ